MAGLLVALLHVAQVVSEILNNWSRETFLFLGVDVVDERTWGDTNLRTVKLERWHDHFDWAGKVVALGLCLVKLFCLELLLHA